jgi:cytochrome c
MAAALATLRDKQRQMQHDPSFDRIDRQGVIGTVIENSKPRWRHAMAAAAVVFVSFHAQAADDAALARARKCMNCHAIDQKLVGPAFKSVASRYANDKDAEARLAKKIRDGGSGSWGVVPMPTNSDVTPDEAKQLAHWVLMQK